MIPHIFQLWLIAMMVVLGVRAEGSVSKYTSLPYDSENRLTGLPEVVRVIGTDGRRQSETGSSSDRQRGNTKDEDPTGLLNCANSRLKVDGEVEIDFGSEVRRESGRASIRSIEPASVPEVGNGYVVTGTFQTWNQDMREVWMEGLDEPVRVTGGHQFFSSSRQAWIEAQALLVGETIRTRDGGDRKVTEVRDLAGEHAVYNIEVESLHQYYVSKVGLLTHNNDKGCSASDKNVKNQSKAIAEGAGKNTLNGGNRIDPSKIAAPPPARGKAPIGTDGKPIELHHTDQATGNASAQSGHR